jgi:hypothetical protein
LLDGGEQPVRKLVDPAADPARGYCRVATVAWLPSRGYRRVATIPNLDSWLDFLYHENVKTTKPIKDRFRNMWLSSFAIGIASLVWLLVRTGAKPSRASYPCQRMAAANASAWLGAAVVPVLLRKVYMVRKNVGAPAVAALFSVTLFALIMVSAANWSSPAVSTEPTIPSVPVEPGTKPGENISGAGKIDLPLKERFLGKPTQSDIFVVKGTNGADDGFTRLVQMIEQDGGGFYRSVEGDYGIVGSNDVVIIKVNSQWDQRGGTNTDLAGSIVSSILNHPEGFTGEIIIADNGQAQFGSSGNGGSLEWRNNNALNPSQSMTDIAADYRDRAHVSAFLWDNITKSKVAEFSDEDDRDGYIVADERTASTRIVLSYPKFTTIFGTKVSFAKGIWDPVTKTYDLERLVVINVPVLKSHAIYGVTGAVKHYMGVVSDKLSGHTAHRSVGSGGMGTQIAQTRAPALNVIDAVWINPRPGNGPSASYSIAVETNVIAASRDPVALDTWASINILIAAAEDLGYSRISRMDPRESSRSSFSKWLELSAKELRKGGFPATTDLSLVNILVEEL